MRLLMAESRHNEVRDPEQELRSSRLRRENKGVELTYTQLTMLVVVLFLAGYLYGILG